ncbi:MAG: NUDIX domain-containing protein [Candidatus Aenigmarchaeota archaeon]|nr:NUDIX domain-containing protein [Candidatus Aenigmarchaeota archaeon]
MIRENSAGGIVFRKDGKQVFILMIRDHNDKYTFPKGLIEKGEKTDKTALREVEEETGVKAELIEKLDDLKFFFVRDGEKVLKTVSFYLMKTQQKELTPQFEVKSAEWIALEEAIETATKKGYKNQEALIEKAIEKIHKIISKKTLKDF